MTPTTTHRVFNFSSGPAVLPEAVLLQAQRDLVEFPGAGMSVMEMSHRSKPFDRILAEAESTLRAVAAIPDTHAVLFLQGGASLQFSMLPMNLLPPGGSADYVITGVWGQKAIAEARKVGAVRVAASTEAGGFLYLVPEFAPDTVFSLHAERRRPLLPAIHIEETAVVPISVVGECRLRCESFSK